ncbi:MAG: snare associated Golgi protein-domain-containing protein [Monoraphidium minutum]|nr:MAG: snare associated Golgi protein-domain-containing protein [Monoraphidium minutum]
MEGGHAPSFPHKRSKGGAGAFDGQGVWNKLRRARHSWLLRGLLVVAVAALLAAAYRAADRRHLTALVKWVDSHGTKGAVALVLVQITCTICLIPTAVLAVAAGALFGFTRGLLLIWAACIVGETLAFALGRYLFRAHIERVSAAWPTWVAMEAALREDGWKLVLLLRCCPASPFTLLNYALGSTSLPFAHFLWPSVFGIAPGIALYVWGGALAKDLGRGTEGALAGGAAPPPQARVAFAALSVATAVLVLVGSAVYTKRALARRLARVEGGGPHVDAEVGRKGSDTDQLGVVQASSDARPGIAQRAAVGGRARHVAGAAVPMAPLPQLSASQPHEAQAPPSLQEQQPLLQSQQLQQAALAPLAGQQRHQPSPPRSVPQGPGPQQLLTA